MNKIYKKHFKLVSLAWAGSFVLALLIYVIVISPQREAKKQMSMQLAEKEKIYTTTLKINQKEARIRLNKQMEQWRDNVGEFVASSEDLAGLTFDIGQIAKDIKIDSFSISSQDNYAAQKASGKYVCEKQMNVEFKSGFNKFASFLNAIERHRPIIFIDEFTITNIEHDASANQVNMVLSVFVKKEQGS